MRQFFKFLFASCFGFILAGLVLVLIGSIVVTRIINNTDKPKAIKPNSVLLLDLSNTIPERTNNQPLEFEDFQTEALLGLHDITKAIRNAADDDNIQGIFLDLSGFSNGQVTGVTLRDALVDFKESGKFIYSFSNYYSQNTYSLASVADEIYVHPMGGVDFRGYAAFIPYFKDMFDKLGIDWQVVYKGKFKSASEPYRLNQMSEANRLQIRAYLDVLYDEFLGGIAASRQVDKEKLREMANDFEIRNAKDALQAGLVTKIDYRGAVLKEIRSRLGLSENDKIPTPGIQQYYANMEKDIAKSAKNQIAVIYAEGTIVDGEGEEGMTGGKKYARLIREIRKKDKVKAIVVRVNSPGGSALASEDIWHELQLASEEGLPVIASMGDLAASGGYYISCGADTIVADPATLTGSIGVVGMIPNMQELMDEKLGIHFDTVLTGPYADGISPFFPIDKQTWSILNNEIDSLYTVFKSRVAKGRSMSMDEVETVAQGRVWAGRDALEVGLVDKMGDLQDAIDIAASKAGVDEYLLVEYPKIKDPLNQLMDMILGNDNNQVRSRVIEAELGEYASYYRHLKELKEMEGVQARLPFFIEFR